MGRLTWAWFSFSFLKFADLSCVFKLIKRDGEILVILSSEAIKLDPAEDPDNRFSTAHISVGAFSNLSPIHFYS